MSKLKIYKELKKFCDKKIKQYPQYEKMYRKEIMLAKRYYDNGRNLYEELHEKEIKNKYVIPFLLNITSEVEEKNFEMRFVYSGSSGGADIDSDFSSLGKEMIQDYLINKYGEDCVLHVGTFSRLGPASAAKDLLRIYKVDYTKSNDFTKCLEKNMDWEDNIKYISETFPQQYKFYEENKSILDLVPHFINKIRQSGSHAGGIVITDEPFYKLIPVDRVSGKVVSAFPESGQEQILDELGIIKYDILGISIMDVIRETIETIDEDLYLIEENGIRKVVLSSYLDEEIKKF